VSATLRRLKINEHSLVDAGANQHAKVLLAKRVSIEKVGPDSSYEAKRDAINGTLTEALGNPYGVGASYWYAEATYEERVIVCMAGKKWAYPVSFDAAGRAVLGTRYEVEVDYRPVNSQEADMDVSKLSPEVKAHVAKLEADGKAAQERVTKLEGEIAELKKAKPPEPEDVLKGLTPEARTIVEKAQKDAAAATERVAKLEDENQTRIFVAKAAELPNLNKASKELGTLLKACAHKLEKPEFEALETLLKAANEQIAKGKLFGTAGTDGTGEADGDTAAAIVEKRATALVADSKAKNMQEARDMAWKENPALWKRHMKERRAS
jgi:hypothetical protein